MKIASLGSGSKGNATLVSDGDTNILVDCGFSLRQFEKRLALLHMNPGDIDAVLLTHEHSDHCGGVVRLSAKFDIPVWTTFGTGRAVFDNSADFNKLCGGHLIAIGSFDVLPVTVPHDAGEPVQFVFHHRPSSKKIGILTDTGHITSHIVAAYGGLDGLLLEFNYDETMLENGPYPFSLKQRVSGDLGHLSNNQSIGLLKEIDTQSLSCLIAAHISEKNNCLSIVEQQLSLLDNIPQPIMASQAAGFDWISV
ncbi:MAG: phosphoribosyl 1,2-cyclic phosphodiesterase [Gammaproteobacteria bacterium]|jgi:phosphoribosyl 1,2-cyclic phosphodiesterase